MTPAEAYAQAMDDPARVLKVRANASLAEVKAAYRKAALAHHPDQNPHPDSARRFRQVTEAYRLLVDQAPRADRRREVPLDLRLRLVIADLTTLVRRWKAGDSERAVDGLRAAVWAASLLDVLAARWPGADRPVAIPTVEGLTQALAAWENPPPPPQGAKERAALGAALAGAEERLRRLRDRPGAARPSTDA